VSGRLTVSLAALAANYAQLCAAAPGEVGAVVKADAYGLGAREIAPYLAQQGCTSFFVATCAEGVDLRDALPDAQIFVFEGVYEQTLAQMCAADLTPVINTPAQLHQWSTVGRSGAIHVDTGMQRLGFSYDAGLQGIPEIPFDLDLFITHFARADAPGHVSVIDQIQRAESIYRGLLAKHPQMRLSLSNSAGVLQGLSLLQGHTRQLGRAGIALYGGNPFHDQANPMQPVVTLEARVMQIREVAAGTPVGYGGSFVTTGPSRLAILGVGYADGYSRLLSNNAHVLVAGQLCPVVGRVSMDLTIVDVSGVDVADVTEGDWVELIGNHISIDEVASQAQTIAYEVLTGLGKRLPRTYR
jgi:alanine racemase